ncbi:MAG: plastocyanin/azurin family copper-binding protein [Ilumatobacteraceae bacterium]
MEDITYDRTALTVRAGETIEFRFTNTGRITHDAFIGDTDAQMEHETEMAEMDGMGGMSHSGDDAAVTVQPGASGELSYTFDQPGTYEVGCHQPGHYAAGMKIDVTVE